MSLNEGELVSRVRIVTGNAAPGPDEAGSLDLVMMDDFIYGGQTFSCSVPGNSLSAGDHTLQVEITLSDQTRRRNAVRWTVIP